MHPFILYNYCFKQSGFYTDIQLTFTSETWRLALTSVFSEASIVYITVVDDLILLILCVGLLLAHGLFERSHW